MSIVESGTELAPSLENPYLNYSAKPFILGSVNEAVDSDKVRWTRTGNAIITLPAGEQIKISPDRQLDRIEPTINALLGNLTPGSSYEEVFNSEKDKYEEALIESGGEIRRLRYGELVYYPERNDLVWFAPRDLKLLAWLARNEIQLKDPEQNISWEKQRELLGNQVIGVVGGSVGMNIFERTRDVLLPSWMKVADPDVFDDANRNRVRFGYADLNQNKAEVAAKQIHATDPWLPVSVYSVGVYPKNISDFMLGNESLGEPPVTMAVEVCDDPDRKIDVGKICKESGIPLWRLTDFGKTFQVEYFPYDRISDFPLAIGMSDGQLLAARDAWKNNPANRELFFDFAFSLVGNHWKNDPEFADFINQRNRTPFTKGIPQTSIASEGGASHTALHMASVLLGWEQPNRHFVDLRSGTQITEYQRKYFDTWVLTRDTQRPFEGTMTHEAILVDSDFRVELTHIDRSGNVYMELYDDEKGETAIQTSGHHTETTKR